jgi:hypothetical protein
MMMNLKSSLIRSTIRKPINADVPTKKRMSSRAAVLSGKKPSKKMKKRWYLQILTYLWSLAVELLEKSFWRSSRRPNSYLLSRASGKIS